MKHRKVDILVKVLKAIAKGIWKLITMIVHGCCRVAGSFLAVAIAAAILYTQLPKLPELFGFNTTSEITDAVVYEQLDAISELAVYEYRYTNHVDCTNVPQLLGHDVWATDHWFAFDYSGAIKVGCNFDEIEVLWVDPTTETVMIHMPDVMVLSNEISIDMETYEDRNNVCNPLEPREVLEYLYSRREPERETAVELGILDLGTQNTQSLIRLAIRSLGYEVVFK